MEEQVAIKEDIGQIERKIISVRGRQVILDRDLAALYGVETKSLNQTVRRNLDRFPDDFMFILDLKEESGLKSQIVTSSWGGNRKPPLAFTEQVQRLEEKQEQTEETIGASLKDLGKRWFAFSLLKDVRPNELLLRIARR